MLKRSTSGGNFLPNALLSSHFTFFFSRKYLTKTVFIEFCSSSTITEHPEQRFPKFCFTCLPLGSLFPQIHQHHTSFMELGHLLTRSGLTYPEVSSNVYHDSFCQSDSNVSLPWVTYFEAFYLHVVSSITFIPVICPKLVLFLAALQFVHLFCNTSKCILLFFSCISSLLLLFVWRHLL